MSNVVDERVVEMRFDNKQFESNVKETMSTLDKLKQKLNFSDSSKSLEKLEDASKKVNMSGMNSAIETVHAKFSALEVIGITALSNITNSAINAGKRIVSALTIDPIKTGFNEYELKMDSMKTIIASTGESTEKVNKLLNELNKYSDETIYSFSDMTQNIGKFTNAGVKLEDAVMAIKGISNEAAVSGANANEASRAMYNFAQALSAGYVKLIDWKSIENANMATKEFKEQLIQAAVSAGTLTKTSDGMYKTLKGHTLTATQNFNDTLTDQWMTTDVLVSTLRDYADETTEIGKKAKAAAQDVTKFSQIFDIAKETAQSGWAQTWEIIFGDIDHAKKLFTPISEFINNLINKMSDFRNNLLEGALNSPFGKLVEKISTVTEVTGAAVEKVQDYSDIVNRVIRGEFGNGQARWDKLTESGYDWIHVQNLVNEKLGNSYRRVENLTESQKEQIKQTGSLTDAQLKELQLTDDEIQQYRELEKAAKAAGLSIDDYIKTLNKKTGKELLIESAKNALQAISKIFGALKGAWTEIFPPATSSQLYKIIEAINSFSKKLIISDANADKLKRTFKGLFAVLDIIRTFVGGAFKVAFRIASAVLSSFGLNILDVTAWIGDVLVKLRNWIKEHDLLGKAINFVVPIITKLIKKISDFIRNSKLIQNGLKGIRKAVSSTSSAIKEWFKGLKEADNIPKYIFGGLINGLKSGFGTLLAFIKPLVQKAIDFVKNLLGIASPSKVFFAIGGFIIAGLIAGLSAAFPKVGEKVKEIIGKFTSNFSEIDWGTVFAGGITAGSLAIVNKFANGIQAIGGMFSGVNDVMSAAAKIMNKSARKIKKILGNVAKVVKSFSKVLNGIAWKFKAEALKDIAIAIGILAAAVIVIALLPIDDVWNAVKVVGALAGIIVILLLVMNFVGGKADSLKNAAASVIKVNGILMGLGAALLSIAIATLIFGLMKPEQFEQGIIAVGAMLVALEIMILAISKTVEKTSAKSIASFALTLYTLGKALKSLALIMLVLGLVDKDILIKGGLAVGYLAVVMAGLIAVVGIFGRDNPAKIGSTLIAVAGAIAILGLITIALGKANPETLAKGLIAVKALSTIVIGLIAVVWFFNEGGKDVGKSLLAVSLAIAILAGITIVLGMVNPENLDAGLDAVRKLSLFIVGLMAAVFFFGGESGNIGKQLLMVAGAIAILAGIGIIFSFLDKGSLAIGLAFVSALAMVIRSLIKVTKDAQNVVGTLVALTVAIAVMAAAVTVLSLMDPVGVAVGAAAMSAMMLVMALLIKVSKDANSSLGAIISLTIAIAFMAIAIGYLANLPVDNLIAASVALSGSLLIFTVCLVLITKIGEMSLTAMASLALMTLVMLTLTVALGYLASFDTESLSAAANALNETLIVFTACLAALTLIGLGGPAAFIGIAALEALIVSLGAVIVAIGALMTKVPALEEFLDKGIVILQKIGEAIGGFLGGIIDGFLSAATANLPEIGTKLSDFAKNVSPFIEIMKTVTLSVLEGAGILAGSIIAITVSELINGYASIFGIDLPALGESLSSFAKNSIWFVGIMSGITNGVLKGTSYMCLAILELTATNVLTNISKLFLVDLPKFGETLSGFANNANDFVKMIKSVKPSVAKGTKALAEAIIILTAASLLDGISNLLGFGTNSIEKFGNQLPKFGEGLSKFSTKVENVDGRKVEIAAKAGERISEMAKKIPRTGGLISVFAGDNDFGDFGDNINNFAEGIYNLNDKCKNIKADVVEAAAKAGERISEMASNIPLTGGIKSWFTGNNDFGEFAENIGKFGEGLFDFDHNLVGINSERATEAAKAAHELVNMANDIEDTGGLFSLFTGDDNLSTIGDELSEFGKALWDFDHNVVGINPERTKLAAEAANELVKMANGVEDSGGFFSLFTGEKNLGNLGTQLTEFAKSLVGFNNILTIGHIDGTNADYLPSFGNKFGELSKLEAPKPIDVELVKSAAEATSALIQATNGIERTGGLSNWLYGVHDINAYGEDIVKLAGVLNTFESKINDNLNTQKVETAVQAMGQIVSANANFRGVWGIQNFNEAVVDYLLPTIQEAYTVLDPINVQNIMAKAKAAIELANELSKLTMPELESFTNGMMRSVGEVFSSFNVVFAAITEEVNHDKWKTKFYEMGGDIMSHIIEGFFGYEEKPYYDGSKEYENSLINVMEGIAKSLRDTIVDSEYLSSSNFEEVGLNVVTGFANGIKNNTYLATQAAHTMGIDVMTATKLAINSNSPSKEFEKIGTYVPMGFANGIDKMAYMSNESAYDMGNNALTSIRKAITSISSIVGSDMDTTPTIRPVLDLSDVTTGARRIGDILSTRPSIGLIGNINSITNSMNNRQNGTTDDVINAIDGLRKALSESVSAGDTYNVNGITYDDGSNISSAIKEIVRAVAMERR